MESHSTGKFRNVMEIPRAKITLHKESEYYEDQYLSAAGRVLTWFYQANHALKIKHVSISPALQMSPKALYTSKKYDKRFICGFKFTE